MIIYRQKAGFTLLELLVVIAIIGILASVAIASMGAARSKSQDTRRVAELKEIQKALSLFFVDNGHYPREGFSEDTGSGIICKTCAGGINTILDEYMTEIPEDPLHDGTTYYYYYDGRHSCGGEVNQAVVYAASMELAGWGNYSDPDDLCTSWGSEGRGGGTNSYNVPMGPSGNN